MTGMLASVNSLQEALLAEAGAVDIVDLKQPAFGALGALATDEVARIVAALRPETRVSATIGDLPMQPARVCDAVARMAATGVDYVKIGFFPDGDPAAVIDALRPLAERHCLIAVLFADAKPDFSLAEQLADGGFAGVMLDTMNKNSAALPELLTFAELSAFVALAKHRGLRVGLAGALRERHIAGLLPLGADYLGFRGALCDLHQRQATLNPMQLAAIRLAVAGAVEPV